MKIYLVRHGETDWNLQERMQGQADNPLNDTGRKQAKIVADKLREINFDAAFSSTLCNPSHPQNDVLMVVRLNALLKSTFFRAV